MSKQRELAAARKMLFIERLFWWHLPLIILFRLLGWEIVAFDPDLGLKSRICGRICLQRGWVQRVVAQHYALGRTHSDAIAHAERIIDRMAGNPVIRALKKLYRDDEIALIFKKALAFDLAATLSMHRFLLQHCAAAEAAVLLGANYKENLRLLQAHGCSIPEVASLRIVEWPAFFRLFHGLMNLAGLTSLGGMAGFLWLAGAFRRKRQRKPQHFKIAVAVSSAFQMKFKGARKFSFLIDDDLIRREDVVFLLEHQPVAEDFIRSHEREGLNLVSVPGRNNVAAFLANPPSSDCAIKALATLARCVPKVVQPQWLLAPAISAVMEYLRWSAVLSDVRCGIYVYSNKEGINQIAANILFRLHGIASCCYSQFIGGPYQVDDVATPFDSRHAYWAFLNCDLYAVNNPAMARSFEKHHHRVGEYKVFGNIFAELIANIDRQDARRHMLPELAGKPEATIIAVFDTSYVDVAEMYSTYEECAAFLRDFIALANRLPDKIFVFKPSKPDAYFIDPKGVWSSPEKGAAIVRLRGEFAALPNTVFLDDAYDPALVIAASDVVVTHCFSSPTADALSARIPAFWYESGEKLRGYPLDRIDGLVAHGLTELEARLHEALTPSYFARITSQDLFHELIEPYLDCRALHRLRTMLKEQVSVAGRG